MYQSDFYEDKNRFADIFNDVLFKGKEVMKSEDLEKDKNKMKKILQNNRSKVDEDSAKAILGMLKVNINLKEIMTIDDGGRTVYNMCKAFEEYREEGRKEGRREGKRAGELSMALQNIKSLMKKQNLSFDDAADLLELAVGIRKHLLTLL